MTWILSTIMLSPAVRAVRSHQREQLIARLGGRQPGRVKRSEAHQRADGGPPGAQSAESAEAQEQAEPGEPTRLDALAVLTGMRPVLLS